MISYLFFNPLGFRFSLRFRFTLRFSFGRELGAIVHLVLDKVAFPKQPDILFFQQGLPISSINRFPIVLTT